MKGGEDLDEVDVGEHTSYTFGRSLTCDFPLEHPSVTSTRFFFFFFRIAECFFSSSSLFFASSCRRVCQVAAELARVFLLWQVSRQHALIVHHENGGVYVIDMKSSHGSFVNGKQLKPYEACRLRDGAEIQFGASSRHYRLRVPHGEAAGRRPASAEKAPIAEPEARAGPSASSANYSAEPEERAEHKKKKRKKDYVSKQARRPAPLVLLYHSPVNT